MYDDTLDSDVSDQNSDKEMKKVMMMIVEAEYSCGKGRDIQKLDSNKMDELKAVIEAEIEHWEFKYEKFESKIWKSCCL